MTKKKLKGGQWQTITHPHASLLASWISLIFKRHSKICFHILPIRISLLQIPLWIKSRPKAFGIFLKLSSKTVPFHAETQAWKKISHTCIYVVVSYIHVFKSSFVRHNLASLEKWLHSKKRKYPDLMLHLLLLSSPSALPFLLTSIFFPHLIRPSETPKLRLRSNWRRRRPHRMWRTHGER